jgi:iron complex outermembrane receptor protein
MRAPTTLVFRPVWAEIRRACATASPLLLAILPVEAAAQAKREHDAGEVVVTARRREESLQQAPLSITALTRTELEQRGATDLGDLTVANLSIRDGGAVSGASFTPMISLRGVGQMDFTINTEPGVGIYLDGVYLGRTLGSVLDLLDIERVEVLRGPQGTLFGRNAIGGAVRVVSRVPQAAEGATGRMSVAAGEGGYRQFKVSGGVPLSERAAVRLSAFVRHRAGYVDALQYDDLDLGEEKVAAARAALRWRPADGLTFDFSADYTRRREAPAASVALRLGALSEVSSAPTGAVATFFNAGLGPAAIARPPFVSVAAPRCASDAAFRAASTACYGDAWVARWGNSSVWTDREGNRITPTNKLDVWGQSLTIDWESPIGRLTVISSRRAFDSTFYNDFDFTPYAIFHNNNVPYKQRQWSHEAQLSGSAWSGALEYVVGAYLFDEGGVEYVDQLDPGDVPAAQASALAAALPYFQTTGRHIDNRSRAAFGQVTFSPSRRLHLTAGLRFTDETKDYRVEQVRAVGPRLSASGRQGSTVWTPSVSLAYEASPRVLVYGSYAEGYRAGGFASRFPGGLPTPLPSYGPEFVTAYELGAKARMFDRRLVLNLAAFRMSYDDIQVTAAVPNLPGFTLNLARAEFTGFEAEASLAVTSRLTVGAFVGLTHKDLTEVAAGTTSGGGTNVAVPITADSRLPGPDWQAGLMLTHHADLPSGGRLTSRFDVEYESDDAGAVTNYPIMVRKGRALANIRLSYASPTGDWEAAIGARNLFNTRFFTTRSLSPAAGSASGTLGRPREAYVEISRRFGE